VAELWLEEVERNVRLDITAPKTAHGHHGYVTKWIVKGVGKLTCREAEKSILVFEELVKTAQDEHGFSTAKNLRNTLTLVCAFAVRYGAMSRNPVLSIAPLREGKRKEPRGLTLEERVELWAKLTKFVASKTVDRL